MGFATFSVEVDAPVELLWSILVDKVENPGKYTGNVDASEVLERTGTTLVRRMQTAAGTVTERIAVDAAALRVDSEFLEHAQFSGTTVKKIGRPEEDGGRPVLTYTLDWEALTPALEGQDLTPVAMAGVEHTRKLAEARHAQEG